ncbi:DUF2252 domain-containing protein, partial [Lichenihabitans sp. Uapishka_5]|uniref:DUF2252 domain-containing protein n=1 Tax=Lichenihabitans sp. Uapishka_5 TaxID=3037302 RepID=UPI0029E7E62E
AAVPREAHAALALPPGRNVGAVLAETDHSRLPGLVPERRRRMAASPFAFFRGGAAVMAADLAGAASAGLTVQGCGDCHIGNFGVARSPEGSLLFDINDFDETLPGVDFTVDLKRLCASLALATQEDGDATPDDAHQAARAAAHAYRKRMGELAVLSPLEVWGASTDVTALLDHVGDGEVATTVKGFVARALSSGEGARNYQKLAASNDGQPPSRWRIADKPPNIFHWSEGAAAGETLQAEAVFAGYRDTLPPERRALLDRYQLADMVFKVVGVGSVGTFCALGLFTTPDGAPLFLQIKEALPSCLTRLTGRDAFAAHQGERVVEGQRLMQSASDPFLGWTTDARTGRQFYVRHLKNKRLGEIAPLVQAHALEPYGRLCGATLARAHARSGDAATMAGYMGESEVFETALAEFAMGYAGAVKGDWQALVGQEKA